MDLIRGLHNLRRRHRGCVATLGTFDGVHHGHRTLLAHLVDKGRELGLPSLLITFEPHPREFLEPENVPSRLTSMREKCHLLRQTGLDRVIVLRFNARTQSISAMEVVELFLVQKLGVRHLVVGDDIRFGKDAEGDFELLVQTGDRFGFGVSRLGTLVDDRSRISSTRVREALSAGDLEQAEGLLGRPYSMMGRVRHGRKLGTSLGVPTANIQPQRIKSPISGVFAVTVSGLDRVHGGVASIGTRPTVDGRGTLLEVHLFDCQGDMYRRMLTVAFHKKLRDEIRFKTLDELKSQMLRDIKDAAESLREKSVIEQHGAGLE